VRSNAERSFTIVAPALLPRVMRQDYGNPVRTTLRRGDTMSRSFTWTKRLCHCH
jgi:hypothetical protein